MAHKSKRKHVKHMHEHPPQARERRPAASFRELGRALVHRIYTRITRKPRAFFSKLSGAY